MLKKKNLVKLDDGLYQVKKARGSNVYLVTEPELALIDAGFPIDAPHIRSALKELGARPGELRMMVATHYHGDHIGTIARLKRAGGARAAIHAQDAPYTTGEMPFDKFRLRLSRFLFYYSLYPLFRYRYFTPDQHLEEGDVIPLLGGLEVLHTPGHSRGSICLYSRSRGLLFSGDLVRREKGVLEGPPPQFTPDTKAAADSLARLAELDFDKLLPGHGEPLLSGAGAIYGEHLRSGALWPAPRALTKKTACLVYMSPAGTTRKVGRRITGLLEGRGYTISELDLARAGSEEIARFVKEELSPASLLVVGSPAYANHALNPVMSFLRALPETHGTPALVYATFGGVGKGVTLVQLAEALKRKGYRVKSAAKVLCVHSLFFKASRPLGQGHPDESDWRVLEKWIGAVAGRLEMDDIYALNSAALRPGNPALRLMVATFFNMRMFGLIFPRYRFCSVRCRRCGACQAQCPTGRLDILPPRRGGKDCLYCMECVRVCPGAAFDAPMWLIQPFIRSMKHLIDRWEDPVTEYYL